MSDYTASLPVRSEADGLDSRVQVKIVDRSNPDTQQATVDTDNNVHVEIHGNDPAGIDRVVRTSEQGALTPDGVYHAANNTVPGTVGVIASVRDADPSNTTMTQRITSVTSGTVRALDVSMHDEDGNPYSVTNPVPVTLVDSEGDEVTVHNEGVDVAAAATSNHDYTAAADFILTQVTFSGSGRMKAVIQVETGVGTGIFTTLYTLFNSVAEPNYTITLKEVVKVPTGVIVRVARTNRDLLPQSLYSTIEGHEP